MGSSDQGTVLREVEADIAAQLAKVQLKPNEVNDEPDALSPDRVSVVKQLATLQATHVALEKAYNDEWNLLKSRYNEKYRRLYDERRATLTSNGEENTGTSALPNFWLRAFQHSRTLMDMIQPYDEPILGYLRDVTYSWADETEQADFSILFSFAPNPYFKNDSLSKTYKMTTQSKTSDRQRDLGYELPPMDHPESALIATVGTEIQWCEGRDITKKTVVRKQKNKRTNETRTVTKVEENPSFFNFFKSYDVPTEAQLEDMTERETEELDAILEIDYDCGVTLREKIIPEAIRWYLGLADDDEETDSELDEEDDGGDDDLPEGL